MQDFDKYLCKYHSSIQQESESIFALPQANTFKKKKKFVKIAQNERKRELHETKKAILLLQPH